jgi:uncharacterized protein (TIGR02594 family)
VSGAVEIADVQRALRARGYDPGREDGDAGPRTIAALQAFQRSAGLVPDGIAGPLTEAALAGAPEPSRRAAPAEPGWLSLARAELGVREAPGAANNARVVRLFADAGFPGIKTDSTAWCAAAVGAMLARSGHRPSGSLAARSYEAWGVGLAAPALGAIGVKRRAGRGWQGHVGFVVGASKDRIVLLGGNQGDAWSIAAFPRPDFTAYRWPADLPLPRPGGLPTTVAGAKAGVREA